MKKLQFQYSVWEEINHSNGTYNEIIVNDIPTYLFVNHICSQDIIIKFFEPKDDCSTQTDISQCKNITKRLCGHTKLKLNGKDNLIIKIISEMRWIIMQIIYPESRSVLCITQYCVTNENV